MFCRNFLTKSYIHIVTIEYILINNNFNFQVLIKIHIV